MGLSELIDVAETTLSTGLAGEVVKWPNRQFTPPAKTTDPSSPAKFYSVNYEFETESTEAADFEGGELIRGWINIGCWVEPQAGDGPVADMVDTVRPLLGADSSTSRIAFLPAHVEQIGFGEMADEVWYGYGVRFPFIAQD